MLDLLCPRDAGHLLGLTTSAVIRLARIGKLPELRDSSGRRFFHRADVERLVAIRVATGLQTRPDVVTGTSTPWKPMNGGRRHRV